MSRIGKQPIEIPENVEVEMDDSFILIKGPKGELKQNLSPEIRVELKDKTLLVFPQKTRRGMSLRAKALWGTTRALIFNMIKGVTEGFEKKLEIQGVGYRASVQGKKLVLSLGFSHPLEMEAPEGIEFKVEKNIITVSGIDKQLVGEIAAEIRSKRKPEPYKGKGIRYLGEKVRRKVGKKAVATEL